MKNTKDKKRFLAPPEDEMKAQEEYQFLEQTAALVGTIIILMGILYMCGLFRDPNMPIFLLLLGIVMNLIRAVRDLRKQNTFLLWVEIGAMSVCLLGALYLIVL